MELNTNNKIKNLNIREKYLKKIGVSIGSLILSTSFFSGCNLNKEVVVNPEYAIEEEIDDSSYEDTKFDLEDKVLLSTFDYPMEIEDNIYTGRNLKYLNSLILRIDDDFDYSFLNYAKNLEYLEIIDYSDGDSLDNIDGENFQKDIIIAINMDPDVGICDEDRYSFLKDIKHINKLILGSKNKPLACDNNFVENLNNVSSIISFSNEKCKTKVKE